MSEILVKLRVDTSNLQQEMKEAEGIAETFGKKIEDNLKIEPDVKGLTDLEKGLKKLVVASGDIDLSEVDKEINKLVKDIPKLNKLMDELNAGLNEMDPNTEEFKEFNKILKGIESEIRKLEAIDNPLAPVSEGAEEVTKKTRTATSEFRAMQEAAIRSGETTSNEFLEVARTAAETKDRIGDVKEAIKVLSSDTFAADALVDGFQQTIAAAQIYEGTMALVGQENEEVAKSIQKLVALQNIAQGAQQLLNFVRGQSAALLALVELRTKAAAFAQGLLTTSTTAATGATKALRLALIGTGIGAIVIAVGALVANWDKFTGVVKKTFPALAGITKFFTEFRQNAAGALNAVIAGFNQVGKVLKNVFSGNFSQAYSDAKKVGTNMANAYNSGFNEKNAQMQRESANKNALTNIKLAESLGKDQRNARIKLYENELKDIEKGSEAALEKQIEINQLKTELAKEGEDKRAAAQAKARDNADKKEKAAEEKKKKDQEDFNKKVLEDRVKQEEELAKELEKARAEYAKLESTDAEPLELEKKKQELRAIEEKYLNDLLVLQSETANKLKDAKDKEGNSLTQDREKELEAARKTNEELIKLNDEYYNAGLKLKLDTIKANEDLNTQQLEDDFKNVKLKDNANKLEKAQFEKLQNEKLQIINQSKIKFAEAQRDAIADVLKGENIDPSTNAAFNELNKKINELRKNGAKLAEEGVIANVRVQFTQEEQDKEKIKKTINELADFAQQGLLMQIGLDPAAVSAFRSQIDNVFEVFNNKASSSEEKFRAVAEVAATSMKIASDLMFNAEAQRIEEERAINAENEAAELEAAEGNEQQKALIKQKYDEKERQLKRRAAENEKRKVLTEIKINTALAIVKAATSAPFPFSLPAIALATALGVAQYAIAASQPIPKFKDGVVGFDGIVGGVGTGTSDSNLAYLSRGESVIPAEATASNLGLIRSLVDNGDPSAYINSHYVLPAIKEAENANKRETEKRLSEMQNLIITSTISQTLKSIEKKGDVNTNKIVEAVSKKSNGFNL